MVTDKEFLKLQEQLAKTQSQLLLFTESQLQFNLSTQNILKSINKFNEEQTKINEQLIHTA